MSIYQKIKNLLGLLNDENLKNFKNLTLLSLLSIPIEILGLGLIVPIFVFLAGGKFLFSPFFESFFLNLNIDNILIILICAFLILNIFRFIFLVYLNNEQLKFRNHVTESLSTFLFSKYLFEKFQKFKKSNIEVLTKNLILEVSEIANNGIYQIIIIVTDLIIAITIVCFLFFQNPGTTLILIIILAILFIFYVSFFRKIIEFLSEKKFTLMSERFSRAYEGLQSYIDIRLNRNENNFLSNYSKESINFFNITRKLTLAQLMPRYFIELILIFFATVVIIFSLNFDIPSEELFGLLALYGFAALRLVPIASRLIFSINTISIAHVAYIKLKNNFKIKKIKNLKKIKYKNKLFSNVIFKDVSFSYGQKKILKKFNYTFKVGKVYRINGANGSGKSTLLYLLMGLVNPDKGKILFDNNDLQKNISQIQNNMSYLGTNSFLLNKTIVNNINFNNDVIYKKNEIIKLANELGFNEVKKKIKNNYIISGYGSNLSSGQKQQISILKALFSNKKIIILDEAINSMDVILKEKLFKYLTKIRHNKLIIFVLHGNNLNKYAHKNILLK